MFANRERRGSQRHNPNVLAVTKSYLAPFLPQAIVGEPFEASQVDVYKGKTSTPPLML